MKEKEFDSKIRNLVDSAPVEQNLGGDVWSKIEARLIHKKKMIVLKRVSYFAVAASLVIGAFLIAPSEENTPVVVLAESQSDQLPEKESVATPIEKPVISEKEELYVEEKVLAQQPSANSPYKQPAQQPTAKPDVQDSPKKEQKTIYDQIEETSYLAMTEDVKKPKRNIILAISSNINPSKGLSENNSSFPQFSSGQGSASNYGIDPISSIKNSLPVTLGIDLQVGLGEKLALGLGVNYTLLHSRYEAIIDGSTQGIVNQNLHYIGVPLNLYYIIIQANSISLYANGGGMLEKGVQVNYNILDLNERSTTREESVAGIQYSVNVGIGFEYKIIDILGVYIDPSLSYFFDGKQPYSIRVSEPLQFRLELGFRFHL